MTQRIILNREPDFSAKAEAFPFQKEAIEFAINREYSAIFYEQGLGKTKIAIDIMLYWLQNKVLDTVLIVTKKSLVENWKQELERHTFIKPRVLSSDKGKNFYTLNSPARVILANYEAVECDKDRIKKFCKLRTAGIILDESTKIKNPNSKLSITFHELSSLFQKRIIMTGTPIANRPEDIWSQIFFLDAGNSLGEDFDKFKKSVQLTNELFCDNKAQNLLTSNLQTIFNKISSFCIRETKDGSGLALPNKVYKNIYCDWSEMQLALYQQIRREEKYTFLQDCQSETEVSDIQIKKLLRLLEAASNQMLINQSLTFPPSKLTYLLEILEKVEERNEKAIIWTSFVNNAEWLKNTLMAFSPVIIHGGIGEIAREKALAEFKENADTKILVAVPAAAKEGLTLTVANNVIFWDRSFSLDDYLQAQDRIHRISQNKTCYIYNLLMKDSIDIWVDKLLEAKSWAAKFVQNDISETIYRQNMDYSYGDLIKDVLDLRRGNGKGNYTHDR